MVSSKFVKIFFVFLMIPGDLLQLGASAVFRFNNPHEAAKLRRRQSVSEPVRVIHGCVFS